MLYHGTPMAIYFKIEGALIVFFGDTYNHRPSIKELGGRFNGTDKTWVVTDSPEMRQKASRFAKGHGLTLEGTPSGGESPSSASDLAVNPPPPKLTDVSPIDPAMGMSISQLLVEAEKIISSGFPAPIWIVGEIQSLTKRGGGTLYFEFADAKTGSHQTATMTVKCNLWQNSVLWLEKRHGKEKIDMIFADGNRLRALVQVKLYKDRGQLTLSIEDVDPSFTQGALALARTELLKKLRLLGLDRKNKLLPMPNFPFRVALISSEGSRAHTDFKHQLLESGHFPGELLFFQCTMQGEKVPKDVVSALKLAHDAGVDLIVISRGGGSAADLRWFDGEEIAMAIAHSKIPIIAAIGHHDDTCIAEELCHTREKTPTAAADRILDIFRDTRTAINEKAHVLAGVLIREMTHFERLQSDLREKLVHATDAYFHRHREHLTSQTTHLQRGFDTVYSKQVSQFIQVGAQLNHFANTQIQRHSEQLFYKEQQLTKLNPGPWLDAGWTQLSAAGKGIKSTKDVKVGTKIQARLRDGIMKLTVDSFEPRAVESKNKSD